MARLIVEQGNPRGAVIELEQEITIGRGDGCGIRMFEKGISRRHACISQRPDGFLLEDLESRNGSFVNNQRVKKCILKNNDLIRIHNWVLRFEDQADATDSEPFLFEEVQEDSAIVQEIPVQTVEHACVSGTEQTELARLQKRMSLMMKLSADIGASTSLKDVFNRILEELFSVLPTADRGFILLQDRKGGTFKPTAMKCRPGCEKKLSISSTITHRAFEEKNAILSCDTTSDARFSSSQSIIQSNIRSFLCAPLVSRDQAFGIIYIDSSKAGNKFSGEDLELITAIASQAAVSIENTQLIGKKIQHERIQQELKVASEVQRKFLPRGVPRHDAYDFFDFYKSAREVGGDFYQFIRVSDDRLAVLCGDVSGKGFSAALVMAKVISEIRYLALQKTGPAEVFAEANKILEGESTEDFFATASLLFLDMPTGTITIADAGHGFPVIFRKNTGTIEESIRLEGIPLGMIRDTEYEETTLKLEKDDLCVITTDGVTEAVAANGDPFGRERIEHVLLENATSVERAGNALVSAVETFTRDTEQHDDITIVCFGRKKETNGYDTSGQDDPVSKNSR